MSDSPDDTDFEIPDGYQLIELTREPIELYKVLKFENAVGSGGEAKMVIGSGLVLVNGLVETQKRKKISTGDTIEFEENKYFIKLSSEAKSPAPRMPKNINPAKINTASRKPIIALRKEGKK
ncbi:MAG: ribosome-associated protein [Pseudohongiellaceae bacterium]|jgi:ribosome-associated protein